MQRSVVSLVIGYWLLVASCKPALEKTLLVVVLMLLGFGDLHPVIVCINLGSVRPFC